LLLSSTSSGIAYEESRRDLPWRAGWKLSRAKTKELILDPDPRSAGLGPPLEKQYDLLEYFDLHAGVPDSIRSYMNSVVTLWLYGWLYYPFYPLAIFLSTTAVEMALKERFPKKGRDHRGLKKLLRKAKGTGLLRDEGFPSLVHRRENAPGWNRKRGELLADFHTLHLQRPMWT
jgi:hypothetical protein